MQPPFAYLSPKLNQVFVSYCRLGISAPSIAPGMSLGFTM